MILMFGCFGVFFSKLNFHYKSASSDTYFRERSPISVHHIEVWNLPWSITYNSIFISNHYQEKCTVFRQAKSWHRHHYTYFVLLKVLYLPIFALCQKISREKKSHKDWHLFSPSHTCWHCAINHNYRRWNLNGFSYDSIHMNVISYKGF